MPWVARTKDAKTKLARPTPAPLRLVRLACGHSTEAAPVVTGTRRLYACPACGRLERERR